MRDSAPSPFHVAPTRAERSQRTELHRPEIRNGDATSRKPRQLRRYNGKYPWRTPQCARSVTLRNTPPSKTRERVAPHPAILGHPPYHLGTAYSARRPFPNIPVQFHQSITMGSKWPASSECSVVRSTRTTGAPSLQ